MAGVTGLPLCVVWFNFVCLLWLCCLCVWLLLCCLCVRCVEKRVASWFNVVLLVFCGFVCCCVVSLFVCVFVFG